ncbi:MAG: putative flavin-containing monooxygenase, partial [Marmoricola sp.]|nr:putative flavin-containing monooxygenase [Marmoricola sp.]
MTQTLDSPPLTPVQRVENWLHGFEEALRARDVARAAGMFAATSFWRDLVSFTWNITTVENPAGVAELLEATLERTDPTFFAL